MDKNIIFVGFMGTGKTTVGRRVSGKLNMDFFDTDEYIKKCENMSVAEVLTKKGKKYFEGAQRFAVRNICENKNALIATGGSTLCDEKCRDIIFKNGITVWLRAKPETIYENLKNSHNKRAELTGKSLEEIVNILDEYSEYYKLSDIVVDVDENTDRDIDAVVDKVVSQIKNYTKEN
ncbi:MAG: AAA family ATPase [Clostridia bacterium]|nr:AAA family ATPase [Clostridia bacterium]